MAKHGKLADKPPHGNLGRKRRRSYLKSGLYGLRTALKRKGLQVVDKRTTIGKDLYNWRDWFTDNLGGLDKMSTQKATVVDLCARQKQLLDSIDAKLLAHLKKDPKIRKMPMMVLKLLQLRQPISDSLRR